MGFEPDRDRFFQYATFVTVGLTALVCACYALLFFNPRVNPIAALRPEVATPDFSVAGLPATWTPTSTFTLRHTPTVTTTQPQPSRDRNARSDRRSDVAPTPTIFFVVVTGVPTIPPPPRPTRDGARAARAATAVQPTPVSTARF